MEDLFFGGGAAWFTTAAIIGTGFFLLRVTMMLVGGDFTDSHGGDVGGDGDALDGHDSEHAFKVLSLQGISAFLMGFGWGGLGGLKGSGWGVTPSLVFGIVAGSGMVWLLGKALEAVYRFQSSGNVSIHSTLGLEGSVYAEVPGTGQGRGQVRLIVDGRERFYTAVSDGGQLPTRSRVRVAHVNDDNTLTVEPLGAELPGEL